MSNLVNIIIPVYKDKMSFFERKSIKQCLKIFKNKDITLIASNTLNLQNYLRIHPFEVVTFEDKHFSNIQSYNKLLLSYPFYKRFSNYTFILIYQPDAFVFRDDMEYWCKKDYDFIGGSVPEEAYKILYSDDILKSIIRVPPFIGNGGFSLRKISSFIRIIESYQNDIEFLYKHKINEDVIFCILLDKANMKLPDREEAKRFSIDALPKSTFESINNKLPFGCHGWFKNDKRYYDNLFWFPYIYPVSGYFIKSFFMIKYRFLKNSSTINQE